MPAIALLLFLRRFLCGHLGGFSLSASALAASRIAFFALAHINSLLGLKRSFLLRAVGRAPSNGPECQAFACIRGSSLRPSEPGEPLDWTRRGRRNRMRLSSGLQGRGTWPTPTTRAIPIRVVRSRRTSSARPGRQQTPLVHLRRQFEPRPMRAGLSK